MKCKKDTENIDPKMVKTKNNRLVLQSKCSVCWIKKSRFLKEQEAKSLLSNLGIKIPLSKIPLLNVLFWMQFHWVWEWMKLWISFYWWELNLCHKCI